MRRIKSVTKNINALFPPNRAPCLCCQVLQKAMKSNQGVIKEFSVDDKGTVMVGALGLPPITGSNPSARACMTAVKIMKGIEVRHYVGGILLPLSKRTPTFFVVSVFFVLSF